MMEINQPAVKIPQRERDSIFQQKKRSQSNALMLEIGIAHITVTFSLNTVYINIYIYLYTFNSEDLILCRCSVWWTLTSIKYDPSTFRRGQMIQHEVNAQFHEYVPTYMLTRFICHVFHTKLQWQLHCILKFGSHMSFDCLECVRCKP